MRMTRWTHGLIIDGRTFSSNLYLKYFQINYWKITGFPTVSFRFLTTQFVDIRSIVISIQKYLDQDVYSSRIGIFREIDGTFSHDWMDNKPPSEIVRASRRASIPEWSQSYILTTRVLLELFLSTVLLSWEIWNETTVLLILNMLIISIFLSNNMICRIQSLRLNIQKI